MTQSTTAQRRTLTTRLLALLTVMCAVVMLEASPAAAVQNGPDPTPASAATFGTFTYARIDLKTNQTPATFGGATIFYPTSTAQTYGGIAGVPGYIFGRAVIEDYAKTLASHGFVVITVDPNKNTDNPNARATALLGALDYLTGSSSVRGRVDSSRLGVFGYSMGGGAAIEAASLRPSLKAAVPMLPWHETKTFNTPVPVGIIGAQNDTNAPVAQHAIPLYENLSGGGEKAFLELAGSNHSFAGADMPTFTRQYVSWMKRWVDGDTRYTQLLCPGPAIDNVKVSDFRSTCPM